MVVNLKRRKAVMSRSIKLGHCVCDPKKPCPCDIMKQYNVCQCAGERLPAKKGPVALTRHVHKAGCASKIGQADLLRILSKLPPITDPNVLIGTAAGDDAGIYRLDERYVLVQTVDVFTPCVDDPYLFGQIAAANSVSDVYAMGGRPITALSIVGFPIEDVDESAMEAMLRGGVDKLNEAGCALIGGHSINDQEVKCGFAVTGLIDARSAIERDKARPGDALVLTKPLGTGMVAFAAQIGRANPQVLDEIGESMATLNKDAAELMVKHGANACTDITGYALAGHLVQMILGSGVSAEIDMSKLPVFASAEVCLRNDVMPGAIERNQEYAMAWVLVDDTSGEENIPILYDPQTSGGLLVSLPEKAAKKLVEEMHQRGHTATAIIGRIVEKEDGDAEGKIVIVNSMLQNIIGDKEAAAMIEKPPEKPIPAQVAAPAESADDEVACCESPPVFDDEDPGPAAPAPPLEHKEGAAADTLALFTHFMKEANKPGRIDARNKRLMAVALSISQHCEPCLKIHIKRALSLGISWQEIDEVANLATAFGGCTAMMFYKEIRTKLRAQA